MSCRIGVIATSEIPIVRRHYCVGFSFLHILSIKTENILQFVTNYNPGVPKLEEILMKNWSLITNNPNLARLLPNAPIVAYRKDKSLKYLLVGAKIPPQP